ncbi:MAG: hypothetical protein V1674_04155 [Candidatus Omnitrophota bacterium]
MQVLVWLVAFYMAVMGLMISIRPKFIRGMIGFWSRAKNLKIGGVLSFIIGIALLAAAPKCRLPVVVVILGIWALIKGALLLVLGIEKVKKIISWYEKQSDLVLRCMGLLVLVLGVALIYAA